MTELSIKVAFCTQLHLTPESRLDAFGPTLLGMAGSCDEPVITAVVGPGGNCASKAVTPKPMCSVTAAMTGTTIIGSETGICTASTIDGAGSPR
jgi:hypothetical protein